MPQRADGEALVNTTIAQYDFIETLGTGTFAVVMSARNRKTGELVAIKVIRKASVSSKQLAKIHREMRIMKKLNHPHIIRLYEVLETTSSLYLVLEYASGGELYDYLIVHGRMKERDARAKFLQLLSAVRYCHRQRVIHRDLKPENILLDANLNIKVADFGFGNFYDPNGVLDTYCGTPAYAAPELFQGQKYTGPEVDVWSLGAILYVMVTSCVPFEGSNLVEMRQSVCTGQIDIPAYLSPGIEELIRHMLVVDRSKRRSIDQFLDAPWLNADGNAIACLKQIYDDGDVQLSDNEDSRKNIDLDVVTHVSSLYQLAVDDVLAALEEDTYDDMSTAYHVYAHHGRARQAQVDRAAPTNDSDELSGSDANDRARGEMPAHGVRSPTPAAPNDAMAESVFPAFIDSLNASRAGSCAQSASDLTDQTLPTTASIVRQVMSPPTKHAAHRGQETVISPSSSMGSDDSPTFVRTSSPRSGGAPAGAMAIPAAFLKTSLPTSPAAQRKLSQEDKRSLGLHVSTSPPSSLSTTASSPRGSPNKGSLLHCILEGDESADIAPSAEPTSPSGSNKPMGFTLAPVGVRRRASSNSANPPIAQLMGTVWNQSSVSTKRGMTASYSIATTTGFVATASPQSMPHPQSLQQPQQPSGRTRTRLRQRSLTPDNVNWYTNGGVMIPSIGDTASGSATVPTTPILTTFKESRKNADGGVSSPPGSPISGSLKQRLSSLFNRRSAHASSSNVHVIAPSIGISSDPGSNHVVANDKPRAMKFMWSSSTTSTKSPQAIVSEIFGAVKALEAKIHARSPFFFRIESSTDTCILEVEICNLPRLQKVYGLRLKRVAGRSSDYKTFTEHLLLMMRL